MTSYVVLIERSADGYGAWCPDLPGCVAVGDTVEETVSAMREAMVIHIDGLREDGQPVPAPATVSATMVDAA